LLQGNASAGAKWLKQYFICKVAGCIKPLFLNPIKAEAALQYRQALQVAHVLDKPFISVVEVPTARINR